MCLATCKPRPQNTHVSATDFICNLFNVPKTEIVCFSSPIKGVTAVDIDYDLAARAVLPNKQPGSSYGINLQVKSAYPYASKEYWNDCYRQLKSSFDLYMNNPIIQRGNADFSVFSVAPIPLIIKLGELIGDKLPCDVYQKTRFPDTWEWQAKELTNNFVVDVEKTDVTNGIVALNISLTIILRNTIDSDSKKNLTPERRFSMSRKMGLKNRENAEIQYIFGFVG